MSTLNLLFFGDVMGRSGRDAALKALPAWKGEHAVDGVIVNVDNAAAGFGVTPAIAKEFLAAGAHVLTGGDHVWDQKETAPYLAQEKRLLRPHNFPPSAPGTGLVEFTTARGHKVVVLHLLGQVFHKEYLDSPFTSADKALEPYRLGGNVQAIFVDMHAEATSEKQAIAHYLDGRVSAVIGSHTHVPTADARILKGATAYLTDAGMCGDYDSIIGVAPEGPMNRFLTKITKHKLEPATGDGTACAALVTLDPATGKATAIRALRAGKML